jgi:hypothetical protein
MTSWRRPSSAAAALTMSLFFSFRKMTTTSLAAAGGKDIFVVSQLYFRVVDVQVAELVSETSITP